MQSLVLRPDNSILQLWTAPLESRVHSITVVFLNQVETQLFPTLDAAIPADQLPSLRGHLEMVKSFLSALAAQANVISYYVCGRSDNETELQFLTTPYTGLVDVSNRLVKVLSSSGIQASGLKKQELYPILKEAAQLMRRLLLIMKAFGMDGLAVCDVRIAKRLLLQFYAGSLGLKESAEWMLSQLPVEPSATGTSALSTETFTRALTTHSSTVATPLSAHRHLAAHQRSKSVHSQAASTVSSNTSSGSGGPARPLAIQAESTINTTFHVLSLMDQTLASSDMEVLRRGRFGNLVDEWSKQQQTTFAAARRFEKHFNVFIASTAVDDSVVRNLLAEISLFITQVTRLVSVSRSLSKEVPLSKTLLVGLQTLTRVTKGLAMHLRDK